MPTPSRIAFALVAASTATALSAELTADKAALSFHPSANWQERSIVRGDFNCDGRQDIAILGTSSQAIVVAIFLSGLSAKPEILSYSAQARDPASAVLGVEDLDFEPGTFPLGDLPEGLRSSKTCKGLNMSDQKVDSAHIYWNRIAQRFDDWVL